MGKEYEFVVAFWGYSSWEPSKWEATFLLPFSEYSKLTLATKLSHFLVQVCVSSSLIKGILINSMYPAYTEHPR